MNVSVPPRENGTVFHELWERMPGYQRSVLFALGVATIGVTVWRYLTHGDHAHTAIELGGYALFLVAGVVVAMPPLGLVILDRIPLPSFLHRRAP